VYPLYTSSKVVLDRANKEVRYFGAEVSSDSYVQQGGIGVLRETKPWKVESVDVDWKNNIFSAIIRPTNANPYQVVMDSILIRQRENLLMARRKTLINLR